MLVCLGLVCTVFSLYIVNSCKEVNPYYIVVLLFEELQTSHRCINSSFIFISEPFHFIAIIRGFKNFAVIANQNTVDVLCLNMCLHIDIIIPPNVEEAQGKRKPV
jgi:hypothetical protein